MRLWTVSDPWRSSFWTYKFCAGRYAAIFSTRTTGRKWSQRRSASHPQKWCVRFCMHLHSGEWDAWIQANDKQSSVSSLAGPFWSPTISLAYDRLSGNEGDRAQWSSLEVGWQPTRAHPDFLLLQIGFRSTLNVEIYGHTIGSPTKLLTYPVFCILIFHGALGSSARYLGWAVGARTASPSTQCPFDTQWMGFLSSSLIFSYRLFLHSNVLDIQSSIIPCIAMFPAYIHVIPLLLSHCKTSSKLTTVLSLTEATELERKEWARNKRRDKVAPIALLKTSMHQSHDSFQCCGKSVVTYHCTTSQVVWLEQKIGGR